MKERTKRLKSEEYIAMRRIRLSHSVTLRFWSVRSDLTHHLAVDNPLHQLARHMTNGHRFLNGHRINGHNNKSSTTSSQEQDEHRIDTLEQALSVIQELKTELRQKNALVEALMQNHLEGAKHIDDPTVGATTLNNSITKKQTPIEEKKNIVRNGTELLAAFEDGYGVIHLDNAAKGNTFDLGTTPIRMTGTRVELYLLDDKAEMVTVRGAFILRQNSYLAIHGGIKRKIRIEAAVKQKPVLDAGEKSSLRLAGISVAGGRDGVYLCGQAVATVDMCCVANCVRGIFEMHRSQATIRGTEFTDNIFHTVLLNKKIEVHSDLKNVAQSGASNGITPVRKRVASLVADRWESSSSESSSRVMLTTGGANTFRGGRGDVVTMYNPMSDEYLEVYSTGGREVKEVKLDEEERTANLSDPIFE